MPDESATTTPVKKKRGPRVPKRPKPTLKVLQTTAGRDLTLAQVYRCFLAGTVTSTELNATVKAFKEFRENKDLREEEKQRQDLKDKTMEVLKRIGKGSVTAEEARAIIESVFEVK